MTRRSQKQLAELDVLEADFRAELVEHLRDCAAGRDSLLFLVGTMRPSAWPSSLRSSIADELFAAAERILTLRAKHGLPGQPCLAAHYRDACRRHVDLEDHHRPGARRQAQLLLQDIGDEQ